ncbi:hypothetical protein NQ315_001817 [Exocentrus adspersus]|uniref:Uncharacterized protein n=1 Tax=Exocentrus adspersus TaxID=1586481 RepID=A0AAV8WC41_9CUCU|nr:hypothetical protein NQ315_001817 [Exocentrus adspersus]
MSVATVENKTGKRPQYKDYVSFLENYKNGKKDDQASDSGVSFSLNNSSNNSSSSIYSDLSETPKNNFKEYLENYNNKKFSSVLPPRAVTKTHEETKTVKTEVFIEINNTNTPTTVSKVVEINNVSNVSKVSKIFENNPGNVIAKTVPPSGKVNTFNFEQRNHKKPDTVNPHKIQLRKSNSISEKSRVFEDSNHEADMRKNGVAKLNGCVSPKPSLKPITVPKAATTEHGAVSPKPNGALSPKPPLNIKPLILPKAVTETLVMQQKENETITPETKEVAPKFTPPPPPLPQETGPCSIPPPPPPPPANFVAPKPNEVTSPPKPRVTSVPKPNGVAPAPKHDVVDGTMRISSKPTTDSNTIDKNDPRVKKLVYGALRGMYGAYHDKANDYIATLPRNRVKKNNGLDSIINSIA